MNAPRPPSPDAALTPEERALAERIAQTRPPREPSPALDARILAAARAAVAPDAPAPARRRARRWPAVTAVAATLVLAVGIAWQLRPIEDVRVEYSEAPSAAARVVAPAGGPVASDGVRRVDIDGTATADEAAAASATPPPEIPAPANPAPRHAPQPVAEPARSRQQEAAAGERRAAPAGADAEAPLLFDQASPMDVATPPAPRPAAFPATAAAPPPAPPAPSPAAPAPPPPAATGEQAASAPAPARDAAAAREASTASRARRESEATPVPSPGTGTATAIGTSASEGGKAVAAPKADAEVLDRIEVTGTRIHDFADESLDDQPPASADSPQVQQAWLQRVRELLADGELEAARDSLREYRRRYPRADLPEDLRALLGE